ncbi:MAG: hypothetical protein RIC16_03370 [Rhodospirillales bacterium]
MTRDTVILIRHGDETGDDRASAWLSGRGFNVEWRAPYEGDVLDEEIADHLAGTVLYGGAHCVDEPEIYPWLADEASWVRRCIAADRPVLGVCLGGQVIADALGAAVGPGTSGLYEFGYYPLIAAEGQDVIPDGLVVSQAHFHEFQLPPGAQHLAGSAAFPNQAFRYGERTFALQFHPEQTVEGFRRWQDADWAHFGKPGAQDRREQDERAAIHDARQEKWFHDFLSRLFGDGPA